MTSVLSSSGARMLSSGGGPAYELQDGASGSNSTGGGAPTSGGGGATGGGGGGAGHSDFDLHAFRVHMAAALNGMSHGHGVGSVAATAATAAAVGPATYSPRFELSTTAAPRAQFGQAHRFLPSKVGYISPQHNSDLLCTASPGPKYAIAPTDATFPRQPAIGWGDKASAMLREKKASFIVEDGNDVGPAAYSPRVAIVKPSAPRCSFSRSSRFGGPFGSYSTLSNSSQPVGSGTSGGVSMLHPNIDATVSQSPRFSFGPPRTARGGGGGPGEPPLQPLVHKSRTTFMTHSIAGGLAAPATLECDIGPGDYDPHLANELGTAQPNPLKTAFGSTSARFIKPGTQYLSAEHARINIGQASPGPSRYTVALGTTGYQPQSARSNTGGLRWCP